MLFGYHRLTKLYLVIVPVLFEIISNVLAESSALPRKLSLPEKLAQPEKSALLEKSLEKSEVTKTPAPISLYHYEYHIHDSNSGDYKSQEESHDGERVIGSYRVADPDGYLRIVNYTADIKNGFRADVHFHRDGSPTTKPQAKVNRTVNHLRNHNYRSNFTPFTPSKPRYVNAVTPSSPVRLTNTAPSRRGVPPAHFESVKNHGSLKTLELQPNWSTIRQESKHIENKEPRTEKDSVVIEMHLNDGSSSDEKSPEVPPNIEKNVKQPTIEPESNKNPALQDIMKVAPEITTKTIENAMSVPIPMPIEIPKIAEEMKAQNSTKVVGMTEESKLDGVPNFTKVVGMSEMLKPEATKIVGESDLLKPETTKVAVMSEEIKPEATRVVGMEEEMRPEATKAVEKAAHDRIKVEVEQIIMDRLHAPTSSSSVHEELKKEAALADKDLRGIQNTNIMNNGEGRSNTALNTDTSNTKSKEELHISVHQNTRIDEAAKNRAQKKYSTLPRPLRLVEQVPVGNYQLQTLTEPTASMTPSENSNGYNYNTNGNSNSYNYNTQGNNDGYYNTNSNSNGYYNTNGNNNFYYDPTLAATVGNFYGNQPGITHINSNSLKPQIYDQYPAESQQYAIGYEWIKMNPRMVNTNNGESYIIMDPDYSSYSTGGKTLFGIPQPTLPHKPTFHNTYFHNWLTKNKPKPHSEPIKPNVDQTPAASTIKEPNVMDQKNAPVPLPLPITRNQQVINADNSPKHDQQIPMYFKKEQEKSANPEPVRDGGGSSKQNLTQKYLESLQAVPFPYQMEVIKVPPPSGVIKQLPVIQPAAINPIPAYTWPTGPVAINPAIAFILLPLQPAQDPPVQPIIVN